MVRQGASIALLLVIGGVLSGCATESSMVRQTSVPAPCATLSAVPSYTIDAGEADYIESYSDIDGDSAEQITKFSGQPVWVDRPQWPISGATGGKMEFIGQIALDPVLFPDSEATMAYLFMTDGSTVTGDFPPTWDPHTGENAVILQPGGVPSVEVIGDETGPTVQSWMVQPDGSYVREQVTWIPVEDRRSDPAYISLTALSEMDDAERDAYGSAIATDKIGGTPYFLQGEEFPYCGDAATLITQFSFVPVDVNLGDGGVAFAFMNPEGTRGGFLWQSH